MIDFPCHYPNCNRTFKRQANLTQHYNSQHRELTPDSEPDPALNYHTVYHPKLNALPCDGDGNFISLHSRPSPSVAPDATKENPWHPFDGRLSFDWAHYYFVELQAPEKKIEKGLDLWLAAKLAARDSTPLPWSSATEMYATIDSIQEGDAPFETISFKYSGPLPPDPPHWMTKTYELCTRDARLLLHNQLCTTDFKDQINLRPYQQFNHQGDRVWSNLMSGDWVWNEADTISQDPRNHGAMLVPIVAGSDKTTVSVATGHQEYHPVYISPGNLTNTARRGRSNAVLPVAFLPISKTSQHQAKCPEFQRFVRQVYHMCLARIFAPLKEAMMEPEVVLCPDGHFRRAIYSLGPYIADYPEQVWLAGTVYWWCPKCDAKPENLDNKNAHWRSHERSDFIINSFDPGIVWREHGIRSDVVPFTHEFPRADIHLLLSPDLLHQLIKGVFKDHLVEWINKYFHTTYGKSRALEIIEDIDQRISAVPSYAGLRRFSDGRNFQQWTGDDSKALMKVYIAAITGYVPSEIVKCLATFMDLCYIFRRNAITSTALKNAEALLDQFHELRGFFVDAGVCTSFKLPRQHALLHYLTSIPLFGSPNGLCSSIMESKHIKAVKEPWRRSSRFRALPQMLRIIVRLEKLTALRRRFLHKSMLVGSTAGYITQSYYKRGNLDDDGDMFMKDSDGDSVSELDTNVDDADEEHPRSTGNQDAGKERLHDIGPVHGPQALSSIVLASTPERKYPKDLATLARYINEPGFPLALSQFLYSRRHPNRSIPDDSDIVAHVNFNSKIQVFHSAITRFYSPSDLCGAGGMYRQRVRCNPSWYGHSRRDTVFVALDDDQPGMAGLLVARVHLFFSFVDDMDQETVPCALVSWFVPASNGRDPDTGMWTVKAEGTRTRRPVQVIHLKSIARGAHLLPKYGVGPLPDHISYANALDEFQTYFVNPYIDHHCHEFLID